MKYITYLSFSFIIFILLTAFSLGALFNSNVLANTDIDKAEAELRKQLEQLEREQAEVQKNLDQQKAQSATLQRDVNVLTGQIKQAELNIKQKNLNIAQLSEGIALKDQTVTQLEEKMERGRLALIELLQAKRDLDQVSLVEIALSEKNLTKFFENLDNYNDIQAALDKLFDEIRDLKGLTEQEKIALKEKQDKERDLRAEIESQKKVVEVKNVEKSGLLSVSKQTEKTYEQVLAEKRQKASAIRAALFSLRDAQGIQFGEALKYAEEASRATGVRAAFILAILKQESDLGKNVGTCNRAGDPESKKWYNIMPGPNDNSWRDDQTIFLAITKKLGLDPESTPLSCPLAGGWGGAMGPSQFIPYTWNAYESRIASALGVSAVSPWNPEHAFTATALYVKDLGAAVGGYTAERTAALKYYAGSNWSLPQNAFYGNSVMQHATAFQEQIDFLNDLN